MCSVETNVLLCFWWSKYCPLQVTKPENFTNKLLNYPYSSCQRKWSSVTGWIPSGLHYVFPRVLLSATSRGWDNSCFFHTQYFQQGDQRAEGKGHTQRSLWETGSSASLGVHAAPSQWGTPGQGRRREMDTEALQLSSRETRVRQECLMHAWPFWELAAPKNTYGAQKWWLF